MRSLIHIPLAGSLPGRALVNLSTAHPVRLPCGVDRRNHCAGAVIEF